MHLLFSIRFTILFLCHIHTEFDFELPLVPVDQTRKCLLSAMRKHPAAFPYTMFLHSSKLWSSIVRVLQSRSN